MNEIIEENDVLAQTGSASITYDDINWNQSEEKNGLIDSSGNQIFGGAYIPVENMNERTTGFLKTIAKPETEYPVKYSYKPAAERWYIDAIYWNVDKEIASKYGVKIQIEQGSLYYRGTWLKITVNAPYKSSSELSEICRRFCTDYGFNNRKELIIRDGYSLLWAEEQKKRSEEDDKVDFIFDSMDD